MNRRHFIGFLTLVCLVVFAIRFGFRAEACPFCSAIAPTFTEQVQKSDIVVLATLKQKPPAFDPNSEEIPTGKFAIVEILKGKEWVDKGFEIETPIFGKYAEGDVFLLMGVEPPRISWSTPQSASSRLIKYLHDISDLPGDVPSRLKFFVNYLEDEEDVLAADAYDEFALAPYKDVIAIKDSIDHDKLIKWISDPEVLTNRKRLYYTLLGVCGSEKDLPLLEQIMSDEDRKKRQGLDSLIACYLMLAGPQGMDFIDKHFVANPDADFSDAFSAVSALRFHSSETDKIPKERIVQSLRSALDTTLMADVVIPDLARLEDWTVIDKLAKMFNEVKEDENWVRIPIISYMKVCPKPEAKEYVKKFREIDPDSVRKAELLMQSSWEDGWDDDESSTDEEGDDTSAKKDKFEKSDKDDPVFENSKGKKNGDKVSDLHVVKKPPVAFISEPVENNEPAVGSAVISTDSDSDLTKLVTSSSDKKNSTASDFVSHFEYRDIVDERSVVAQAAGEQSTVVVANALPPSIVSVLMVSFAASSVIFVLCWSVLSGWFLRLIY
jgi:hypothetical protein